MSFEPRINISSIRDSIAYQYSESTKFIEYLEVLLEPFDELEEVYADILNKRLFDTATTDALDTWGIILDQPRESYDAGDVLYFGMNASDPSDPVQQAGLGDINNPEVGGVFRSIDQPVSTVAILQNPDYKDVLRSKEYRNNYKGGTENLISAIEDTLGCTGQGSFEIEEVFTTPTDPFVRITFNCMLSDLQKVYLESLDVLPKPGGIRYEYVYT